MITERFPMIVGGEEVLTEHLLSTIMKGAR